MKPLAVLAATSLLLVSTSAQAAAPSGGGRFTGFTKTTRFLSAEPLWQRMTAERSNRHLVPFQATATPTDTSTPTPTPTTTPTYPDPVVLLQNTAQVYTAIQTAHVELITVAEKPSIQKLTIDGSGDATCKGPSLKMTVKGTSLLEGTSQSATTKAYFVQIKNKTWKKGSSKSAKWKAINANNVTVYGFPFPIGNPLVCPSASSTGGGSGSGAPTDVFKDAQTLGPDTFKGNPVWHVQETDVRTLTDGSTVSFLLDFLIGQTHYIPYVLTQTFDDTADGITISQTQITTKIGEKVKKIKNPITGK